MPSNQESLLTLQSASTSRLTIFCFRSLKLQQHIKQLFSQPWIHGGISQSQYGTSTSPVLAWKSLVQWALEILHFVWKVLLGTRKCMHLTPREWKADGFMLWMIYPRLAAMLFQCSGAPAKKITFHWSEQAWFSSRTPQAKPVSHPPLYLQHVVPGMMYGTFLWSFFVPKWNKSSL